MSNALIPSVHMLPISMLKLKWKGKSVSRAAFRSGVHDNRPEHLPIDEAATTSIVWRSLNMIYSPLNYKHVDVHRRSATVHRVTLGRWPLQF